MQKARSLNLIKLMLFVHYYIYNYITQEIFRHQLHMRGGEEEKESVQKAKNQIG